MYGKTGVRRWVRGRLLCTLIGFVSTLPTLPPIDVSDLNVHISSATMVSNSPFGRWGLPERAPVEPQRVSDPFFVFTTTGAATPSGLLPPYHLQPPPR